MQVSPAPVSAPERYTVYGLIVDSDLDLPLSNHDKSHEKGGKEAADVRIHMASPCLGNKEASSSRYGRCYYATPDEARLYYEGVAEIHIRGGKEIIIYPFPNVGLAWLSQFIIGVSLGILMHQRGHYSLHAAVVEMAGGAVAIAGWKRMGKSTTSAALYSAGYRLVSDDTLICDFPDITTALPGVRQFKLDPLAAEKALGVDPESLPRLHESYDRRIRQFLDEDPLPSFPLKRIYILEWGEEVAIEELPAALAFEELVRHSYSPRFLGNRGGMMKHFKQVSELARTGLVCRLTRPKSTDALPDVVKAIEKMEGCISQDS